MMPNDTKPLSGSTKQGNSPTHRVGATTLAVFQLFSAHFPKQSRPKPWNRSCRRSRGSAGSGRRAAVVTHGMHRQRTDGRAFTAPLLRVLQHTASTSQRCQKKAASALLKVREAQDVRGGFNVCWSSELRENKTLAPTLLQGWLNRADGTSKGSFGF